MILRVARDRAKACVGTASAFDTSSSSIIRDYTNRMNKRHRILWFNREFFPHALILFSQATTRFDVSNCHVGLRVSFGLRVMTPIAGTTPTISCGSIGIFSFILLIILEAHRLHGRAQLPLSSDKYLRDHQQRDPLAVLSGKFLHAMDKKYHTTQHVLISGVHNWGVLNILSKLLRQNASLDRGSKVFPLCYMPR